MKVLVTAASKHGATAEIARRIGEVLSSAGIETDVRPPDQVASVAPYDAVILGSGVYAGRWLEPARSLVERESAALASRRVWLFSSGPVGDPAKPDGEPEDVALIRKRTHAIDHRVFPGKLDRRELGFAEKAIVAVFHAAEGDFRAWETVTDWASGIAQTLQPRPVETR
jgi:menaquinone-dependent protoporphyrinogen oxidase